VYRYFHDPAKDEVQMLRQRIVWLVILAVTPSFSIHAETAAPREAIEAPSPSEQVPDISLPYPPIFPFQQEPKPVTGLNKLFSTAKPGSTVKCDLTFPAKALGKGANAYGEFTVKGGTATIHTEHGQVEFSSRGVTVKPRPDKEAKKFGDRTCGFRFLKEAPSARSWLSLSSDSPIMDELVPEIYRNLAMPIRKEGKHWKVRLAVALSPDFDGAISWRVDLPRK
jgi:hypothetical protein